MTQEQMLEQIVKQVMSSMSTAAAPAPAACGTVSKADYPIGGACGARLLRRRAC